MPEIAVLSVISGRLKQLELIQELNLVVNS